MTINQRIKELRTSKGLSQADFGHKIGLKHGAVSKMEKDGSTIIDQNIRLISQAFGVSERWLRTGDGPQKVDEEEAFVKKMVERYQMKGFEENVIRAWLSLSPEQRDSILCSAWSLVQRIDEYETAHPSGELMTDEQAQFVEDRRQAMERFKANYNARHGIPQDEREADIEARRQADIARINAEYDAEKKGLSPTSSTQGTAAPSEKRKEVTQ